MLCELPTQQASVALHRVRSLLTESELDVTEYSSDWFQRRGRAGRQFPLLIGHELDFDLGVSLVVGVETLTADRFDTAVVWRSLVVLFPARRRLVSSALQ